MVEQEQWGAEGVQPPLNHFHYIRYNFNAGCSAGSAPLFVIRRITPYLSGQEPSSSVVHKFVNELCCNLLSRELAGKQSCIMHRYAVNSAST